MGAEVLSECGRVGQTVQTLLAGLAESAEDLGQLTRWVEAALGAVVGDVAPESLGRQGETSGRLPRLHGALEELRDTLGDERFVDWAGSRLSLLGLVWSTRSLRADEPPAAG